MFVLQSKRRDRVVKNRQKKVDVQVKKVPNERYKKLCLLLILQKNVTSVMTSAMRVKATKKGRLILAQQLSYEN